MKRPAFTLVELLVVISIIGLLSTIAAVSLSSSRSAARDTKRKADIRQISQAVELYYNSNGNLPTNGGWCTYISNPTYLTFVNDIAPFMAKVPSDPQKPVQVGDYLYFNLADTAGRYALCANMEKATGNSYNYTSCADGAFYNYCIYPNGQ
jgi:prepilin-type N-terminal cleavage/methylation domain-containing protein